METLSQEAILLGMQGAIQEDEKDECKKVPTTPLTTGLCTSKEKFVV